LLDLCLADERIHRDPEALVGVKELGDSSINFLVRFWVDRAEFWNIQYDLQHKIVDTFREKGIEIPFPQVDVHFDK
jgi:small conductance mechanosensitive channel